MKKFFFMALALALSSGIKAQTYTPVAVTGYNADVVADGTGTVLASTNQDIDGVNYNFMVLGYTNTNTPPATSIRGLPVNRIITSAVTATPGLTYELAPYTANNSLRINGTGTGTLTFPTPTAAEKVYVLATSGSGTSNSTFVVNFTDGTSQSFTQSVADWYTGTNTAITGLGRANRTDNTIDNNTTAPRLYQFELALSLANSTKTIQSLTFNNTGTGNVLNVMGITIKASPPQALNDAGITAITAPVSPILQNTSQAVQATLVNQGSSTLTSALITWKVNGVAQTAFPWTGSLPSNQSTSITIGNFTFPAGSHTITAKATNPNNATDGFAANDSAQTTISSCYSLTGTYTIDKTSPASATNFQSIGAAVSAMTCGIGISGPVTFNVVAGSGPYTEQIEIPAINGASATNTITFNGNGDTIQANPTASASRHVIKLNGADYVTINNFKIFTTGTGNTSTTYGWGIHFMNGADNNTISNNTIAIGSLSTTESASSGIVFSGSTSSVISAANNGNNNTITGNTITGGYHGIVIYNQTTTANNNTITNNTIKDFQLSGIRLYNTKNALVEGNSISRTNRAGVTNFEGITLGSSTQGVTVSKNRIFDSHIGATSLTGYAYGIYSNSDDAPANIENIIKNNLIYNFNNTGTAYGLYNSSSDGVYYYHNTVNLDNTANTGSVRGFYQTLAATNIQLLNNVINVTGGATGAKHAVYYGTTTSSIRSNNNILFVTSTATTSGIGSWGTANKANLLDWTTASGDDSASYTMDPLFTGVTTANFLPTATGVNNIGKPVLPAVTDDITGALRNPVTPDPGAYEIGTYTPPSNDAGVSAITAPNSGCNLTSQEVITITVNNFGATTLSNIPVSYTINGGTAVNEIVAGPIAAGSTATYSFTATANLSSPGSYSIVASTNLSGDALATNNAFTKTVVSLATPATPTITAGGATTFCAGGSVVLTAASTTTGVTYTWFKDGVAVTGATSATYTANTTGNYTAVVAATGCSSAASAATTVTVNPAPATPSTSNGSATTFCAGGSVVFSVISPVTGATYQWFNNGTAITGATGTSYTATASGSYTVTATSGGCTSPASAVRTVTVTPIPAVPTITATSTTICSGGSVVLTAASATTGATYTWFNNGTLITGATAATYTATTAGSYTAVATTTGCASAASTATTVTVNAAPAIPVITAGTSTTFCNGDSVTLTAASATTGATYAWSLNGNPIAGATTATYKAKAAGNYTVTASANGCDATSTATSVTVTPLPATPTITRNGFTLTSSSATGNQWYKDNNIITGATAATYNTTANGSYTVKVTSNGCSSAVSNSIAVANTGIHDDKNKLTVSVYPNPSNGLFNLNLPEGQTYEVVVTDLTGKVTQQKTIKAKTAQLVLSQAAKGVYMLRIVSENQTATKKLIVE